MNSDFGGQMPDDFQMAVRRLRERITDDEWDRLSMHQQAEAVYEELRALDAERFLRRDKEGNNARPDPDRDRERKPMPLPIIEIAFDG
jgi:hypothetical protein